MNRFQREEMGIYLCVKVGPSREKSRIHVSPIKCLEPGAPRVDKQVVECRVVLQRSHLKPQRAPHVPYNGRLVGRRGILEDGAGGADVDVDALDFCLESRHRFNVVNAHKKRRIDQAWSRIDQANIRVSPRLDNRQIRHEGDTIQGS